MKLSQTFYLVEKSPSAESVCVAGYSKKPSTCSMNSHWSDITWTETVGMKRFVLRNQHGDKVEKVESFRFMTLVIFSSFICRGLDMHSPANLTQVSGLMFEVHSSSTENGLQPGLWYS